MIQKCCRELHNKVHHVIASAWYTTVHVITSAINHDVICSSRSVHSKPPLNVRSLSKSDIRYIHIYVLDSFTLSITITPIYILYQLSRRYSLINLYLQGTHHSDGESIHEIFTRGAKGNNDNATSLQLL